MNYINEGTQYLDMLKELQESKQIESYKPTEPNKNKTGQLKDKDGNENEIKLIDGYYVDENGNKWNSGYIKKEDAIEYSKSLINCKDCEDCKRCKDCNDCFACDDCTDCNFCRHCNDCLACNHCTNCSRCFDCSNCTNCSNCRDCNNCNISDNLMNKNDYTHNNDDKDKNERNLRDIIGLDGWETFRIDDEVYNLSHDYTLYSIIHGNKNSRLSVHELIEMIIQNKKVEKIFIANDIEIKVLECFEILGYTKFIKISENTHLFISEGDELDTFKLNDSFKSVEIQSKYIFKKINVNDTFNINDVLKVTTLFNKQNEEITCN